MTTHALLSSGADFVRYNCATKRIEVSIGGVEYTTPIPASGLAGSVFFQPDPLTVVELRGDTRRLLSTGAGRRLAAAPSRWRSLAATPALRPPAVGVDWTTSLDGVETGRGDVEVGYLLTSEGSRRFFEFDGTQVDVTYVPTDATFDINSTQIAFQAAGQWVAPALAADVGEQTVRVTIPGAGLRTVIAYDGAMRSTFGAWIQSIVPVDGTICRLAPVPAATGKKAILTLNDSLLFNVPTGIVQRDSTIGILRELGNAIVYCTGTGGNRFSTVGAERAQVAQLIMANAMACGVVDPSDIAVVLALGKNEWKDALYPDAGALTTFQGYVEDQVEQIAQLLPNVPIYVQGILPSAVDATNAEGQTQAPYDATLSAAATATDATFLDASAYLDPETGLQPDVIHLSLAGHISVAAALAAQFGLA